MGFLDSLESSLNNLERGAEKEDAGREHQKRQSDRERRQSIAPWADRLKHSPYTTSLMSIATREGFRMRAKVYITWVGDALRLDARDLRLELRPFAEGIQAVFIRDGAEQTTRVLDLDGDPALLVNDWLVISTPTQS